MASLTFGVIGVGHFGKNYVRLLQNLEGVELSQVANSAKESQALLENPRIDCVVIATPVSTHFQLTSSAIEAGKHVLVEKPMVRNLEEAAELGKIVKKSGRTFMVGHQYLYNDFIRKLKEYLVSGTIGETRYIFAEHLYFGPIRYDVGCFWETATHDIAIIDYLFRLAKIINVSGGAVDMVEKGRDDFASVQVTFDTGLMVSIVTSWFWPVKTRRMTLVGRKGMALFDDRVEDFKLKIIPQLYPEGPKEKGKFSSFMEIDQSSIVVPKVLAREPLQNELEHFIDCVREKKTPLSDIEHGLRVTEVLDTIARTIRN